MKKNFILLFVIALLTGCYGPDGVGDCPDYPQPYRSTVFIEGVVLDDSTFAAISECVVLFSAEDAGSYGCDGYIYYDTDTTSVQGEFKITAFTGGGGLKFSAPGYKVYRPDYGVLDTVLL